MEIKRVAVIGAGAMGSQIAINTALHGFHVALYDVSAEMLAKAEGFLQGWLPERVAKGRLTEEQAAATRARLAFEPDLAKAVAEADLVIEAVVENLAVKRELFAKLDQLAQPHAILATNSSSIVSSKLASATGRPAQVANLHYFNPALVMKLVEVVQGPHTSPETAMALVAFCRATGKDPILMLKEIDGFVANRLLGALISEAAFLYENGYASFEDIDRAAEKALGHPMGPFRLMDMTGIDVSYFVRLERYKETGNEADKPFRCIAEKVERGELGQKSGRGFYDYTKGGKP